MMIGRRPAAFVTVLGSRGRGKHNWEYSTDSIGGPEYIQHRNENLTQQAFAKGFSSMDEKVFFPAMIVPFLSRKDQYLYYHHFFFSSFPIIIIKTSTSHPNTPTAMKSLTRHAHTHTPINPPPAPQENHPHDKRPTSQPFPHPRTFFSGRWVRTPQDVNPRPAPPPNRTFFLSSQPGIIPWLSLFFSTCEP